jgi:hypothetical protein
MELHLVNANTENGKGTMEFSFTEENLEADPDICLILSTYFEVANIERSIKEIERLNLDISELVIDGCARSVSCVMDH